jgi:hypothetical protein
MIVEMRFGGMNVEEVAQAIGVSSAPWKRADRGSCLAAP